MALSKYLYVEGDPPFIHHQGKCWRRLTDQALAGTTLVAGVDDVKLYNTSNECFGITDLHEISEIQALVKVAPGGVITLDPTSELDMSIFKIRDISAHAVSHLTSETITLDTIMIGVSKFSIVEISALAGVKDYAVAHSYNVFDDNNLTDSDIPTHIVGTSNYETVIKPDILTFLASLPQ